MIAVSQGIVVPGTKKSQICSKQITKPFGVWRIFINFVIPYRPQARAMREAQNELSYK